MSTTHGRDAGRAWLDAINDPDNQRSLEPYHRYAVEPRTLFEAIRDDISRADRDIQAKAFVALVTGLPALTDIVYERHTENPKWREEDGESQTLMTQGMDVVTELYTQIFVKNTFERDNHGKRRNPVGYAERMAKNWESDERRYLGKLAYAVSIDDESIVEVSESDLDELHDNLAYETCRDELVTMEFLTVSERRMFEAIYVEGILRNEYAKSLGISMFALEKRMERARSKVTAVRDEYLAALLWRNLEEGDTNLSDILSQGGTLSENSMHTNYLLKSETSLSDGSRGPWVSEMVVFLTTKYGGGIGNIYVMGLSESMPIHVQARIDPRTEFITQAPWATMAPWNIKDAHVRGKEVSKVRDKLIHFSGMDRSWPAGYEYAEHNPIIVARDDEKTGEYSYIIPLDNSPAIDGSEIKRYQWCSYLRNPTGVGKIDCLVKEIIGYGLQPILVARFEAGKFPIRIQGRRGRPSFSPIKIGGI